MNNWRKCELSAENCGLVDGIWYILEVQGAKRPLLGQWDEKNDRFVGSGLVSKELDEAIPLKSGKVLYFTECPKREVMIGIDLSMNKEELAAINKSDEETGWDLFRPYHWKELK